MSSDAEAKARPTSWSRKRGWMVAVGLVLLVAMVYVTGANRFISWDALRENKGNLAAWVSEHPVSAAFFYVLIYVCIVGASVPGATVLTLTGGVLFPQPWCTALAVCGATGGACLIFMVARTTFGRPLREAVHAWGGSVTENIERGLRSDRALLYLMILRLVPVFPFWFVNVAPAVFRVPLATFAMGTMFGIVPGSFVYTRAGNILGLATDIPADETLSSFLIRTLWTADMGWAVGLLGVWIAILAVAQRMLAKVVPPPPLREASSKARGKGHRQRNDSFSSHRDGLDASDGGAATPLGQVTTE